MILSPRPKLILLKSDITALTGCYREQCVLRGTTTSSCRRLWTKAHNHSSLYCGIKDVSTRREVCTVDDSTTSGMAC